MIQKELFLWWFMDSQHGVIKRPASISANKVSIQQTSWRFNELQRNCGEGLDLKSAKYHSWRQQKSNNIILFSTLGTKSYIKADKIEWSHRKTTLIGNQFEPMANIEIWLKSIGSCSVKWNFIRRTFLWLQTFKLTYCSILYEPFALSFFT